MMSQEFEASFNPVEIIRKKRDGEALTKEEIKFFIDDFTSGSVGDYQMSSMLMAIYLNGMNKDETAWLTDAMLYSGETLNFEESVVIDKHSTGGVGDKASFILAPIAAAAGVKVPMMAGRGLGHTGGTVDKVECIPGFQTSLELESFKSRVIEDGICLIGQTDKFAPADKKIYALRDVTATIESIPLITASIMSKKLAEGANGIVMDIKTGNGAFMATKTQARALAKSLLATASRFDKKMAVYISDMNQPLGNKVGHTLEILECIETLKGKGPKDLTDLSLELAGSMIYLAEKAKSHQKGIALAKKVLKSGEAFKVFVDMIKNQGGDTSYLASPERFPLAPMQTVVKANSSGFVKKIDTREVGLACVALGGGRMKKSDKIDFEVGFDFHVTLGQKVKVGTPLLTIYHHRHQLPLIEKMSEAFVEEIFSLSKTKPKNTPPLIHEVYI